MRLTSPDVIRSRFALVHEEKMSAWDESHAEPDLPSLVEVRADFKAGRIRINDESALSLAIGGDERKSIFDIIVPRSISSYNAKLEAHQSARRYYSSLQLEALNDFLNRILLDGDNAFLLLQDFRKWEPPSPQPQHAKCRQKRR